MPNIGHLKLLKLITSSYPGLLAYIGEDFRYQYTNDEYSSWFRSIPEKLEGVLVKDVIGVKAFNYRLSHMQLALQGKEVKFSTFIDHPELGPRDVEQNYIPDFREDGSVRGFLAMALDITEHKKAEQLARENEARFRSLAEVMPQLVWIADAEGLLIYVNENWTKVTNAPLRDNLGNGWLNLIHPEDRISTILAWKETLKGKSNHESEYRLRISDGSYRWHVSRAIGIKDPNDKIIRWVGTTTDIEEQKNAGEVALKEKKRMFSLFMQAPVSICALNGPEHILELVNDSAKKIFNEREVNGLPIKRALPELEDQNILQLIDEVYHSGKGKLFPAECLKLPYGRDKIKEQFFDLLFEPIKDENSLTTGILCMMVDVSEQVRALKQSEEKERNLEEALLARDEFLSVASHELKTPLTSLKLQAQLTLRTLQMNREFSLEKQTTMANQTSQLIGRLTRLIDDMLDVSRIKTGKLQLERDTHDLGDIIREVVFSMSVLFEAAGLPLPQIDIPEKTLGEWDRFRLEQVIGNLLTNAIRYGLGKPIKIEASVSENKVLFSVTDLGYGIDSEDLDRIFDRFERAINSSEVSGLGLGLFISKEIVESHGGKIWVKSKKGEGSTFFVELPLRPAL